MLRNESSKKRLGLTCESTGARRARGGSSARTCGTRTRRRRWRTRTAAPGWARAAPTAAGGDSATGGAGSTPTSSCRCDWLLLRRDEFSVGCSWFLVVVVGGGVVVGVFYFCAPPSSIVLYPFGGWKGEMRWQRVTRMAGGGEREGQRVTGKLWMERQRRWTDGCQRRKMPHVLLNIVRGRTRPIRLRARPKGTGADLRAVVPGGHFFPLLVLVPALGWRGRGKG